MKIYKAGDIIDSKLDGWFYSPALLRLYYQVKRGHILIGHFLRPYQLLAKYKGTEHEAEVLAFMMGAE